MSTINRLTTSRLSNFVVATCARRSDGTDVSPNIWLTEQGGRLRFNHEVVDYNGQGAQRQQASVKFTGRQSGLGRAGHHQPVPAHQPRLLLPVARRPER